MEAIENGMYRVFANRFYEHKEVGVERKKVLTINPHFNEIIGIGENDEMVVLVANHSSKVQT